MSELACPPHHRFCTPSRSTTLLPCGCRVTKDRVLHRDFHGDPLGIDSETIVDPTPKCYIDHDDPVPAYAKLR